MLERYLQPMELISFFVEAKGTATNIEVISNFKPFLSKTDLGKENYDYLKRLTNKLVIVKKIQGSKCLQLRPEFERLSAFEILTNLKREYGDQEISNGPQESIKKGSDNERPEMEASSMEEPEMKVTSDLGDKAEDLSHVTDTLTRARSRHPIPTELERDFDLYIETSATGSEDQLTEKEIQAPENFESTSTEEMQEQNDEVLSLPNLEAKERTLERSHVSVKDLSKSYESKIQENQPPPLPPRAPKAPRKLVGERNNQSGTSDIIKDPYPYTSLTPEKRKWIVAASKNDEVTLRKLVSENPSLIGTRDPTTGYTALHWAARRGNDGLLHLLVGRYGMEVNIRSRGGYTPLMLAAAFKKHHVFDLLMNPYGANPNLRDFSGKTAEQYLPDGGDKADHVDGASAMSSTFQDAQKARRKVDKTSSFLRGLVRDSLRSSHHKRPRSFEE